MNKALEGAISWLLVIASVVGLVMGIMNKSVLFIILFSVFILYSIYNLIKQFRK